MQLRRWTALPIVLAALLVLAVPMASPRLVRGVEPDAAASSSPTLSTLPYNASVFIEPLPFSLDASAVTGIYGLSGGDFNADGKSDFAVTYQAGIGAAQRNVLAVVLGDGSYRYLPPISLTLPMSPTPTSTMTSPVGLGIVARDFNADGKLDIAVAGGLSRSVLLYSGIGDGRFVTPTVLSTTNEPTVIDSADMNLDGKQDLVTLDRTSGALSVFLASGPGTFAVPSVYSTTAGAQDFAIAPFNGDSKPDVLVAANQTALQSLAVLTNKGSGLLNNAVVVSTSKKLNGLFLEDFDGDSKVDLTAAGQLSTLTGWEAYFSKGNNNGTFQSPTADQVVKLPSDARRGLGARQSIDLNADGKPDVIYLHGNTLTVGLNIGGGRFSHSQYTATPGTGYSGGDADLAMGNSFIVTDFNKDGASDVILGVVNPAGQSQLVLLPGNPAKNGSLRSARHFPVDDQSLALSLGDDQAFAVTDLNKDERPDLVVPQSAGGVAIKSYLTTGDAVLGTEIASLSVLGTGPVGRVRTGDFDGDGKTDVGWLTFPGLGGVGDPRENVAFGDGGGRFIQLVTVPVTGTDHVFADFAGDQKPDIMVARGGAIDLVEHTSARTFSVRRVLTIPTAPTGVTIAAGDLNNDGKPDLVFSYRTEGLNPPVVMRSTNLGNGAFSTPTAVYTFTRSMEPLKTLIVADLNGDKLPEIIGTEADRVFVLKNLGTAFSGPAFFDFAFGRELGQPSQLVLHDLDGDAKPDLMAVGPAGWSLRVLPGNGDGTFRTDVARLFATGTRETEGVAVGDFNLDGRPDLLISHRALANTRFELLYNNPNRVASGKGFGGLGPGLNNAIRTIVAANSNAPRVSGVAASTDAQVYAGGEFVQSGDSQANYAAQWNASTQGWNSLSTGTNGTVNTMASSGSVLYSGGSFTQAGGQPAANIAQYNTLTLGWNSLGSGTNGPVLSMAAAGTSVYVGGSFSQAGGQNSANFAEWNTATSGWNSVSGSPNGAVKGLAAVGNEIYVGGNFTATGGVPNTMAIAVYNTQTKLWSSLGGISGTVNAVLQVGTLVYVGGNFSLVNGLAVRNIAVYDTATGQWAAMSGGVNGPVNALTSSADGLVVGGEFTVAGEVTASNLALWNGTTWLPLATGTNGAVYALSSNGTTVYVGGTFTELGGQPANNIGSYGTAKPMVFLGFLVSKP